MIESADEFVRLRTSEVREEYERAALEEAPIEVWLDVIECYPNMKKWVAHNKKVPLAILDRLSRDPDLVVRQWVAWKRKAGREIFERLARDPEPKVRSALVTNAKLPLDILEQLAADAEKWIAEAARERIEYRREENERKARRAAR
jgi:hypothetical protein